MPVLPPWANVIGVTVTSDVAVSELRKLIFPEGTTVQYIGVGPALESSVPDVAAPLLSVARISATSAFVPDDVDLPTTVMAAASTPPLLDEVMVMVPLVTTIWLCPVMSMVLPVVI